MKYVIRLIKSDAFWDGFWNVFRHPLFVYGAGVVMGIFLCAVLK